MKYRPFYPFEQNSQPSPPHSFFGGWQQGGPPGPGFFGAGHGGPGPGPFRGGRGPHHGRHFPGGPGGHGGHGGGSKLEYYLQTADRFMSTAQQYAPLIHRFAPMLSNIPALLSIYKGFSSAPSAGSGLAGGAANAAADTGAPLPSSPRIFQPPV